MLFKSYLIINFSHIKFPLGILPTVLSLFIWPQGCVLEPLSQFSQFHETAACFCFSSSFPALCLHLWLSGYPVTQLATGFTENHHVLSPECASIVSGQPLTLAPKPLAGPRARGTQSSQLSPRNSVEWVLNYVATTRASYIICGVQGTMKIWSFLLKWQEKTYSFLLWCLSWPVTVIFICCSWPVMVNVYLLLSFVLPQAGDS